MTAAERAREVVDNVERIHGEAFVQHVRDCMRGVVRSALLAHEAEVRAKLTEASPTTSDWCPTCKQGWHVAKSEQALRVRLARIEAEVREECAVIADKIAAMREDGAGESPRGQRCRQIARMIRDSGRKKEREG